MGIDWPAVGREVQRLRKLAKLKQQELADRIKASQATITRLETGNLPVSIDVLERLSVAFRCRIVDLIIETPSPRRRRRLPKA